MPRIVEEVPGALPTRSDGGTGSGVGPAPDRPRRPTTRARELRNNATPAEKRLWKYISRRQLGWKFSRQMPIGPFICDFLCREARLVVELDGGQHSERIEQDASRTAYLEREGYRVVRFWNNDVLERLEGVLETIIEELRTAPDLPSRLREGSGVGTADEPGATSVSPPLPTATPWAPSPPASGRGDL